MKKIWLILLVVVSLTFVLAACQPQTVEVEVTRVVTETDTVTEEVEVTRVVTETETETVTEEVEVTRVVEVAAVPTDMTVVEFWTTDNEEDRVDVYESIAASFMAENPGIEVRIVPIEEGGITQRIATAQAANRLPDIVRMGIERVAAFAADGILDQDAAEAVIASVGEDDFRAGPLAMVTDPATGQYAAVPFDGWIQAIWYRQDVFDEAGLEAPTSWDAINAACETLPGAGNLLYAVTLGTDPGQNYGQQVFEQVAMSNDAWPFDADGNVTMNTPEMIEALQFYTDLQNCAAPGPQYWRGAREVSPGPFLCVKPAATDVTVVCDRWPDGSDVRQFGLDVARLSGAKTDHQKALAVYRWVRRWMIFTGNGKGAPAERLSRRLRKHPCIHEGAKLLNVYGAHWCGGQARVVEQVWRALGFRAEKVCRGGHTIVGMHYRDYDGVERRDGFLADTDCIVKQGLLPGGR